jgi:hypothetical protein
MLNLNDRFFLSPAFHHTETEMELNLAMDSQHKQQRRSRFNYLLDELNQLTDHCQLHEGLEPDLKLRIVDWLRSLTCVSMQTHQPAASNGHTDNTSFVNSCLKVSRFDLLTPGNVQIFLF